MADLVALVDQDLYLQVVVVEVAAQVPTAVVEVLVIMQFSKLVAVVEAPGTEVVAVVVLDLLQVLVVVVQTAVVLEPAEEQVLVDYLLLLLEEMLQ